MDDSLGRIFLWHAMQEKAVRWSCLTLGHCLLGHDPIMVALQMNDFSAIKYHMNVQNKYVDDFHPVITRNST